jgi:hypothetical protein
LQADLELGFSPSPTHMDGNLCDYPPPWCTAPRHVGGGVSRLPAECGRWRLVRRVDSAPGP